MTTTIHFSGLNTQPASLIHPASDSPLRAGPRTSLLTWWLTFGQVGLESLVILTHWVTLSNFIPHSGNPNDLSLSRHDNRFGNRRDDCFGAAGPFVNVMPAFAADSKLKGIIAICFLKPGKPGGLGGGCDVSLHAGSIDAEWTRSTAEKFADAFFFNFSAQIPERGVQA